MYITSSKSRSGWLKAFGSALGVVGPILLQGLKSLLDFGIEYEQVQTDKTSGGIKFLAKTANGHKLKVKCLPTSGRKGLWDMYILTEDGTKKSYPQIKDSQIDDILTKFIDSKWGSDTLERRYEDAKNTNDLNNSNADFDVDSSKHLRVTLQKITAASESCVECTAVETNMCPADGYDALACVCDDDAFCDTLSETPQTFDIVPVDDSYDVTPCDDLPRTYTTYEELIRASYTALLNLQNLHWNLKGNQFFRLHTLLDDYTKTAYSSIDTLAEFGLRSHDFTANPVIMVQGLMNYCPNGNITTIDGLEIIKQIISDYIAALELYYPNLTHDEQSVLDNWIDYWRNECQYKLNRMDVL